MKIRKARKKDARKICLLRRKTLRNWNKKDYPKAFLKFLINKNSTKEIVNKIRKKEVFCLWDGDNLLGTINLEGNKVGGFFIKSTKVKEGFGTSLMDFIENYAHSKKIKKLRLYSTKFAFNFYKKRGYHLVKAKYWIFKGNKVRDRIMEKKI